MSFAYTYIGMLPDAGQLAADLTYCSRLQDRPLRVTSPADDSDEILSLSLADDFFLSYGIDPATEIESCGFTNYTRVRQTVLQYSIWHGKKTPARWTDQSAAGLCRILSAFASEHAPPWMGSQFSALIRNVLETAAREGRWPACRA